MDEQDVIPALASLTAGLVGRYDLITYLDRLVHSCRDVLGGGATGLLVEAADTGLALLAASSQSSAEIEMYQALVGDGPCLQALRTGKVVVTTHPADMVQRWRAAGPVIVGAGFQSALSVPVTWDGRPIAALNSFFRAPQTFVTDHFTASQAFADLVGIALLHHEQVIDTAFVTAAVNAAFDARTTVNHACATVARQEGIPLESTVLVMSETATLQGVTLTELAGEVLERATHGKYWRD